MDAATKDSARLIDGKAFAAEVRTSRRRAMWRQLKADHGITPGLAVVLVGSDAASEVYVRNKGIQTREAGHGGFRASASPRPPARTNWMALIVQPSFLLKRTDGVTGR